MEPLGRQKETLSASPSQDFSRYFLTVAASFVYLLLAVWLSMCLGLL